MAIRSLQMLASFTLVVGMICLGEVDASGPDDQAPAAPPGAQEMLRVGLRGVYFVPNHGQWADEEVIYGFKSRGLDVAFHESSFTMHLSRERSERSEDSEPGRVGPTSVLRALDDSSDRIRSGSLDDSQYEHLTLSVSFPGSNPVTPRGAQPQTAKFNYFVGGEGRGIASNVPSFGAVIYEDLYFGIDLHVTGNDDGVLKYEFHCAPGADYSQIRIHYDGIESLCVNADGDLEIATSFGTLCDGAPIVWQEDSDSTSRAVSMRRAREEAVFDDAPLADTRGSSDPTITTRFELIDKHTYRIAIEGAVDSARQLVIDPEVEWMYYSGGSGADYGKSIGLDSAGNALITGYTDSTDFAGRNNSRFGGTYDAFVVKIGAAGELRWMTYLGGAGSDHGDGIAADDQANVLVAGTTSSRDFAGANNSHHGGTMDGFVVRIGPSGVLEWMIYLGGSSGEGASGIAVDGAGNALVVGSTGSTDFVGRNNSAPGSGDAFVVKVSPSGQLHWMTYLGGSTGLDEGYGIAVDASGDALVAGYTESRDFPARNNSFHGGEGDAFVLRITSEGSMRWMTYLGGDEIDHGSSIAVDDAGFALVTGWTWSSNFSGRNNACHSCIPPFFTDAFVLKVGPAGGLQWMTFVGGTGASGGRSIAAGPAGSALVSGGTTARDFEGHNNSYRGGNTDAFVLQVNSLGELQWMTYLGGSEIDGGDGIVAQHSGNIWVAGFTGSTDFTGRHNAYSGGYRDAFVLKLRLDEGPQLTVSATCPSGGPIRIEWSGATPGGQIALIYARNTGSFTIPNNRPCAGTQLGLGTNQIQLAFQGGAGSNGSRILNANAGPGACGGYLQLLDLSTCNTSNVARVE